MEITETIHAKDPMDEIIMRILMDLHGYVTAKTIARLALKKYDTEITTNQITKHILHIPVKVFSAPINNSSNRGKKNSYRLDLPDTGS